MTKDNANTNIITLKNKYASITITFYSSTNHWHYIYVKIRNLCCTIVITNTDKNIINTKVTDKVKLVLNYIHDNYSNNISINTLANICDYSEYHFMRFFKKHIGMTCIQYINNYRLEKASLLLNSTSKPIMDISLEVGFDNLSYFNKLFKNKYNLTPKEFRSNKNKVFT